jgi:hypothetical protein
MIFKLTRAEKGPDGKWRKLRARLYNPPIPVDRTVENANAPIDRNDPIDVQIERLLWIPTYLVGRFLYQYPCLESEADELFSVALEVLIDMIHSDVNARNIKSHTIVNATFEMEKYANQLDSVVVTSTKTRYLKQKEGEEVATSFRLRSDDSFVEDEEHLILIEEACESLGIDIEGASLAERRQLARKLELPEDKLRQK